MVLTTHKHTVNLWATQNDALETIETKTKEKFIKLHGMSVRGRAYNEACNDIIDDVKNLKNNI